MAKARRQKMTAIIYDKRGRVLSIGKNSYEKSHTYQAKIAKSVGLEMKTQLHAEIAAILRLKYTDKPHKIFVSRIMQDGSYGLAKPCPVCSRAIELAGIEIVEHT